MEALCADHGQAGVCVAEHQNRVRHDLRHQLVAARDDVAHGLAQVRADRVQVDLGIVQFEVVEEHAVKVVVVVLPCVRKNLVKIFPALLDHRYQADDLRPCADNDQQLQLAVFFPIHVKRETIIARVIVESIIIGLLILGRGLRLHSSTDNTFN